MQHNDHSYRGWMRKNEIFLIQGLFFRNAKKTDHHYITSFIKNSNNIIIYDMILEQYFIKYFIYLFLI